MDSSVDTSTGRRHRRTLRKTLLRASLGSVIAVGLASGSYAAASSSLGASIHAQRTPETRTAHAEAPGEARLRAMMASGECWGNDHRPHPSPSRVWLVEPWSGSGDVKYVLRGRAVVDATLSGASTAQVARYCA